MTIIVEAWGDGYRAYVKENPGIWEYAHTSEAALGKLFLSLSVRQMLDCTIEVQQP